MSIVGNYQQALGRIGELTRDLATVTADWKLERSVREEISGELRAERAAHADTRKALEELKKERNWLTKENARLVANGQADIAAVRQSTRAELAKAEARVKELEHHWDEHCRMHKDGCYRG